jgi:hypothetical protein
MSYALIPQHYGFVVAQHQLIGLILPLVLISFTAYEGA